MQAREVRLLRPRRRVARRLQSVSRTIIEHRLVDVGARLKRLRADVAVAEEQLRFLEDEAQDARLRALVSETPIAEAEASDSRRHADSLARYRDDLLRTITRLVSEQDSLLDRMAAYLPSRPGPIPGEQQ